MGYLEGILVKIYDIEKVREPIEGSRFHSVKEYLRYNWEEIEKIPEFAKLKEAQQSPRWHGEGNAWEHTKLVCAAAERKCHEFGWRYDNEPSLCITLMTAALFHDIGKGVSSFQGKDGRWHSYGHEETGEKITRRLLWDTGYAFREAICVLVRWHMFPLMVFEKKKNGFVDDIIKVAAKLNEVHSLSGGFPATYDILIMLKECDLEGSIQEDTNSKHGDFIKLEELTSIVSGMGVRNKFNNWWLSFAVGKHDYPLATDYRKPLNVYMMIGLPGAGKDTFIKKMFEPEPEFLEEDGDSSITIHLEKDKCVVLCRDDIRAELGYCNAGEKIVGTSEQENTVTKIFNERMLAAAKEGKTLIINNINLKKKYREQLKNDLSNYKVCMHYVYIETNGLSKNRYRRVGDIPDDIWGKMIENFDWPDFEEYDEIRVFTNE